jgi:Sec-independent protein translocase protein TatA
MSEFSLFHWLVVLALIIVLCFGRRGAEVMRDLGDHLNNFRGGGGSGPSHPLPATGAVETSRGAENPKESKPIGPTRPSNG